MRAYDSVERKKRGENQQWGSGFFVLGRMLGQDAVETRAVFHIWIVTETLGVGFGEW